MAEVISGSDGSLLNSPDSVDHVSATRTGSVCIGVSVDRWKAAIAGFGDDDSAFTWHLLDIHEQFCDICRPCTPNRTMSSATEGDNSELTDVLLADADDEDIESDDEMEDAAANVKRQPLSKSMLKPSGKLYSCDQCEKTFGRKDHLTLHLRTHSGTRPYGCDLCDASFVSISGLRRHSLIHSGEKRYQCTECGESFTQSNHLKYHLTTHQGQKQYTCELCDRSLADKRSYESHLRGHAGDRPYACGVCDKSFTDSNSLRRHGKSHTGERSHQCDTCGLTFAESSFLKDHQRIHTGHRPHICDECGRAFIQASSLVKHKRTHLGDKSYQCSVCGKCFMGGSNFLRHLKTHDSGRPGRAVPVPENTCADCGKQFINNRGLQQHKIRHRLKEDTDESLGLQIDTMLHRLESQGQTSAHMAEAAGGSDGQPKLQTIKHQDWEVRDKLQTVASPVDQTNYIRYNESVN